MRRQLEKIFNPSSIAIIGASARPNTVGQGIMYNMLTSGFSGIIYPVNLHRKSVMGVKAYASIDEVPERVDLAIICTIASSVPDLVEACGKAGAGGLVIISGGFSEAGAQGAALQEQVRQLARKYGMRIVGPNCLGFINVHQGVNACFAPRQALPGRLALISQSAAMLTSILDWSVVQGVGFSQVISLGGMMDVDIADLIDYLGSDPQTACILIYMEGLRNPQRFMSAARAFARNKPIIVLKSGRTEAGARASLTHTGALAGQDEVYDAAFQRAGIIRVDTVAQLFHMAQAVAMQALPRANRLAIVTNAGGPGILATDYLIRYGGQLSSLEDKTLDKLQAVLPECWSGSNPVDILEAADDRAYRDVLLACAKDKTVDGILVILTPQSMNDPLKVAEAVVDVSKKTQKTILASWMGEADVTVGRERLEEGSIPTYRYPESAVDVFLRMYTYRRDLELLYETPPAIPDHIEPDREAARAIIDATLQEGRNLLTEMEARQLLKYYGITVGRHKLCTSEAEAIAFAEELGYPVVAKIASAELVHKTEAGGVKLNLWNRDQVRQAFVQVMQNARQYAPEAHIDGVLIERMVRHGFELLIGAHKDPVFGPVLLFGQGGVAVQVFKDVRMGLPPMNMALARRLIQHSRIYPLLSGYRGQPGVDLSELAFLLVTFSYLVMDFPQILSVEINPYMVDEKGGIALDAQVVLDNALSEPIKRPFQHMAIAPYPGQQYTRKVSLKKGIQAVMRPIRPEDEPEMEQMLSGVSNDSLYMRFFGFIPKVTHDWMTRFIHIDYNREMAIVAETEVDGHLEMMGVVRIIEDAWGETAEYSILVADQWQGYGLGNELTDYILEIARERGIQKIVASVLPGNSAMVHMFERRGFSVDRSEMEVYDVELTL